MTLSGMNLLSDDSEDEIENIDPYRRKYQLLSERCEVLQQDNERLAFRTQQTRKKRNRERRMRKAIMDRLDKYGDAWRNVPLMLPDPATQTVVKVEKTSPKTSPNKGLPAQKTGSEKTPSKAAKSTASGSATKRKSTQKSDKPDRDPNAPKRPVNPFFVFCNEQQLLVSEQMAEQHPGEPELTKAELNKHLAAKWNTLSADDRKIYYSIFEKSKERYIEEMAIYKRERPQSASTS